MKEEKELISVIIPVYNSERYVEECVKSILAQTYSNLEIIVVDDGSTDESSMVCDKVAKTDTRMLVFHLPNGGVAKARNFGLDQAKGKYVAFVDSDDIVEENFIERAVQGMNGAEYVSAAFQTFNKRKKVSDVDYMKNRGDIVTCREYLKIMSSYQAGAYWGANWGKLFLLRIIKENNIRFESNIAFAEDFRFNIEYLKYVNFISLLHNPSYFYRIDTNESLSKQKRDIDTFWKEYLTLYKRCVELYSIHGIAEEVEINAAMFLINAYIAVIRQGICCEDMRLSDAIALCRRLAQCPELQSAAGMNKRMKGKTRYCAYLISHNHSALIAVVLSIKQQLKLWRTGM